MSESDSLLDVQTFNLLLRTSYGVLHVWLGNYAGIYLIKLATVKIYACVAREYVEKVQFQLNLKSVKCTTIRIFVLAKEVNRL